MLQLTSLLLALAAAPQDFGGFDGIPDQPATVTAQVVESADGPLLRARFEVSDGWHLYHPDQDSKMGLPIGIRLAPASVAAGPLRTSVEPEREYNEFMEGEFLLLGGVFHIDLPLRLPRPEFEAEIVWQACDENSCLPPESKSFLFPADDRAGPAVRETESGDAPLDSGSNSLLGLILAAVAAALGALATPCVFPMIPITVSFFAKREEKGEGNALASATVYGLGIIATYLLLGVGLAALLGASAGNALASSPWMNIFLGSLFVFFALSLLGMYDIQVPGWLQKLVSPASSAGSKRGGYVPVFLMAIAFTVTAFTCTMPFVGGLLGIAAMTGEWGAAIVGIGVYASVFAAPFFLLALTPSALKRLPQAGGWMNAVKVSMGYLELIAAFKFFSNTDLVWQMNILTRPVMIALTAAIFLAWALYLLGVYRLPHDYDPIEVVGVMRVLTATGLLAVAIYISVGLLGGRFGGWLEAYFPPLGYGGTGLAPASAVADGGSGQEHIAPAGLSWHDNLGSALAASQESGRPVFLDFTGITCVNCRLMEGDVFPRPEVRSLLEQFERAELYVDFGPYKGENSRMQLERFARAQQPFYVILSPQDEVIATFEGFTRDIPSFVKFLEKGLSGR